MLFEVIEMEKSYINAYDVAGILGLNRSTVYKLAKEKTLPSIRIGGSVLFDQKVIVDFIKNGGGRQ